MDNTWNKWRAGLARTSKTTFGRIASFLGATEINTDTWENLEALLIQADLGVEVTQSILDDLHEAVHRDGLTQTDQIQSALQSALRQRLESPPTFDFSNRPSVILLVGVNGSGKTTSAAKIGQRFQQNGKKVMLAAADTYRAAAIDQLQRWGERLKIPVIAGQPNGDPGAVAYDAVQAAVARKYDILLIDTAGRLHTRFNLMEELKKVYRVTGKALPGAPHAVWLVLDATTGQNALHQAKAFKDAVHVDGVILTKLDSSARGGMAFAIQHTLNLPILFAGLGEAAEDLQPFNPDAFIEGITSNF